MRHLTGGVCLRQIALPAKVFNSADTCSSARENNLGPGEERTLPSAAFLHAPTWPSDPARTTFPSGAAQRYTCRRGHASDM
jgi:hypothetical protein